MNSGVGSRMRLAVALSLVSTVSLAASVPYLAPNGQKVQGEVVGNKLLIMDSKGVAKAAPDGLYRSPDGKLINVVKGNVVLPVDAATPMPQGKVGGPKPGPIPRPDPKSAAAGSGSAPASTTGSAAFPPGLPPPKVDGKVAAPPGMDGPAYTSPGGLTKESEKPKPEGPGPKPDPK